MEKKAVRQEIRERIQKLNQREIHRFNREINSHIVNSRLFLEGKVIMGYLAEPGEVNIDQSLQTALNMGKTVCVPQILEAPGEMAAARLVTLKSWDGTGTGSGRPRSRWRPSPRKTSTWC